MALGECGISAVGTTDFQHLTLVGWFRRDQWRWDFNLIPSFVWFFSQYKKILEFNLNVYAIRHTLVFLFLNQFKSEIMANTYHKIYLQAVFAVKYRLALIKPEWKKDLFAVIGNLINETGCQTISVNGVEDHVHCLFTLKPVVSISDVMQVAKGKSSKFINESGFLNTRFEWQSGYGVFSYNESAIPNLVRYLENQEAHHKKQEFLSEYQGILKTFKVEYDPDYIFTEPI